MLSTSLHQSVITELSGHCGRCSGLWERRLERSLVCVITNNVRRYYRKWKWCFQLSHNAPKCADFNTKLRTFSGINTRRFIFGSALFGPSPNSHFETRCFVAGNRPSRHTHFVSTDVWSVLHYTVGRLLLISTCTIDLIRTCASCRAGMSTKVNIKRHFPTSSQGQICKAKARVFKAKTTSGRPRSKLDIPKAKAKD